MAGSRSFKWDDDTEVYSESQVEYAIEFAGIDIDSQTGTHFLVYCPFHHNTDSPAMAVDKEKGLFTCFNPSCDERGTIIDLLQRTKKLTYFQAYRVLVKGKTSGGKSVAQRVQEALEKRPDFVEFPQITLDKMYEDFAGSVAEEYMLARGFDKETLDYFRVGYSQKQNMVIVPMHDPNGMPIGLIGRTPSKDDKRFKNSKNLPKSVTAWNFHRAKRTGDTVIICEASFDAMKIHQAGFPHVIALLGGHISEFHAEQIGKHFSTIILMTDFDRKKEYKANCRKCKHIEFQYGDVRCIGHRAGRDLGRQVIDKLPNKRVLWGVYDEEEVYPRNAKDATDMTEAEINQCLRNAVNNFEYNARDYE
jgi:DNA primase